MTKGVKRMVAAKERVKRQDARCSRCGRRVQPWRMKNYQQGASDGDDEAVGVCLCPGCLKDEAREVDVDGVSYALNVIRQARVEVYRRQVEETGRLDYDDPQLEAATRRAQEEILRALAATAKKTGAALSNDSDEEEEEGEAEGHD